MAALRLNVQADSHGASATGTIIGTQATTALVLEVTNLKSQAPASYAVTCQPAPVPVAAIRLKVQARADSASATIIGTQATTALVLLLLVVAGAATGMIATAAVADSDNFKLNSPA